MTTSDEIEWAIKENAVGLVPEHWEVKSVAELVAEGVLAKIQDGNHGEIHPVSTDYVSTGVPFIMSGDIRNGRVDVRGCKFIHPDHARSLRVGHSKKGDVLLTHKGNELGRSGILRDADNAVLTPQVTYYRIQSPQVLDPEFLRWLFESPKFQYQFKRDAAQSTRPYVSITNQQSLYLSLPPISEQKAIAAALGSLDNKIEINRRMNATLEAMAQALFKSWFVDFDPVKAKAAGRELEGLDADIAEFFSNEFEESERGPIPKGWELRKIGEILELAYGKALKDSNRISGGIPVFGSNGQIGWHNERLVKGPGIVVGRKGNPGTVIWIDEDFFPIDTTFYVKSEVSLLFLFHLLKQQDFPSLSADSAVPGLNRNLAYMNSAVIPPYEIVEAFERITLGLYALRFAKVREAGLLANIRDTLLPKLISGKISIPDADRKD